MAAAWTQKAGEGLAIVKIGGYESDRYWDNDSQLRRSPAYRKLELNPYVEYGVNDRATVGANSFLLRVEQEGDGSNSGVGDVELFGRYRLHTDGWDSLSAQALLKITAGYDEDEVVPLGAGQFDVEGRFLYGRGGIYESSGGRNRGITTLKSHTANDWASPRMNSASTGRPAGGRARHGRWNSSKKTF